MPCHTPLRGHNATFAQRPAPVRCMKARLCLANRSPCCILFCGFNFSGVSHSSGSGLRSRHGQEGRLGRKRRRCGGGGVLQRGSAVHVHRAPDGISGVPRARCSDQGCGGGGGWRWASGGGDEQIGRDLYAKALIWDYKRFGNLIRGRPAVADGAFCASTSL